MTTESDAVLATIIDNWGNGGYGGATPAIHSTTDIAVDRWAALDAVIVLHDTLDELHPPVNDKYVDKQYIMDIRVTSITSEDQLKLLVEEVEYLLNNTAITGFTSVRVTRKWRGSSDRKRKVYRNDISIEFWARVSSSAIAPSGGTTTTFETDELTVNTSIAGTPTAALGNTAITGTASVSGATTLSDTVNLIVGKKLIFDSDADDNNYIYAAAENQLNVSVEATEVWRWFASLISCRLPFHPAADKTLDMGTTGALRWDDIYADDFVNESPYKKFDSPLSELKKIKDKKDKDDRDEIDYNSLPDWIRQTEYKWEKNEAGNMEKVGEKTELNKQGFSVNRMVVFLWQALQQALTRIEALEAEA